MPSLIQGDSPASVSTIYKSLPIGQPNPDSSSLRLLPSQVTALSEVDIRNQLLQGHYILEDKEKWSAIVFLQSHCRLGILM